MPLCELYCLLLVSPVSLFLLSSTPPCFVKMEHPASTPLGTAWPAKSTQVSNELKSALVSHQYMEVMEEGTSSESATNGDGIETKALELNTQVSKKILHP